MAVSATRPPSLDLQLDAWNGQPSHLSPSAHVCVLHPEPPLWHTSGRQPTENLLKMPRLAVSLSYISSPLNAAHLYVHRSTKSSYGLLKLTGCARLLASEP